MMCRVKYTTTLDEDLLVLAKSKARMDGLEGANAVIEKALRVYFHNCSVTVWEKNLNSGLLQKLIVRPTKLVLETVQQRKITNDYNRHLVADNVLMNRGWQKVWHMAK